MVSLWSAGISFVACLAATYGLYATAVGLRIRRAASDH
jgi:hypothetical protein